MEERTLRILEFHRIREQVAQHCASDMGKELALAHMPRTELGEVNTLLKQTLEAEEAMRFTGGNPVRSFDNTEKSIRRARVGGMLSMRELLSLGQGMEAAEVLRRALIRPDAVPTLLSAMASNLTITRDLADDIRRCIISEEEMSDNASADLAQIRRQIRMCNERVREKLQSLVRSAAFAKYLQEPIVTMRGDRFVVPVKQECRSNVPGIVHDQSGSGQTLFIEPMAAVEINNKLREYTAREREEMERILAALSARVGVYADDLLRNLMAMAALDFIFARAVYGDTIRANPPEMNDRGILDIRRGRHPMIPRDKVVPLDVWLGQDFNTLLVTGPNTGGKTVTLKTVGLLTVMAQSGLFVPAEHGTKLSVFKHVFADIGDEQSIEQSLSTFSGHMTNIVRILDEADDRSLVLLDELGAGTDPTEGAALAMSILDDLHGRNARVMATTHYSELKAFALTRDGIENASMEFNVETLRPTYHLSVGIPGRSNAFEISKRLGLEQRIIDHAKEYLSKNDIRFEDVIGRAETHRQVAARERERAEQARKETIALRNKMDAMQKQMEQQREKLLRQAREEARRIVHSAKEESEQLIRQIRQTNQKALSEAEITRLAQENRAATAKKLEELAEPLAVSGQNVPAYDQPVPKDLKAGETVMLLKVGQTATVLTAPDDKGEVTVQAGIIKMKVKLEDVRRDKPEKQKKTSKSGTRPGIMHKEISMSLDLRGMTVDEAEAAVDQYLDDCLMGGLTEVSLVHGKGTGALRSGLHAYLRRHPKVKGFRIGAYGEGDAGVTIVQLK